MLVAETNCGIKFLYYSAVIRVSIILLLYVKTAYTEHYDLGPYHVTRD